MQINAQTGLSALQHVAKILEGVTSDSKSLIDYTNVARVEPIVVIDADVMYQEMLPDVMQSLQSLFTGYYLQAFSLSMNVGDIDVVRQLEKFNPNRSVGSAIGQSLGTALNVGAGTGHMISGQIGMNSMGLEGLDDFTHRLPVVGDPRNAHQVAMEAADGRATTRDINQITNELSNLSIGKLVNVEIVSGDKKATIPISIRLLANQITTDGMIHILTAGNKEVSFGERWHQWKSGQIEFLKDLVLCQDLIDEHKKHLMDDKDGLYDAILRRRASNKVSGVLTGNFSVATASNLCVLSSNTATQVELSNNMAFKNFASRQKIFESTYMMIMAVIDKDWDRVTFYHRGIPEATTLSARDLKAVNKNTGPDIKDILTAFRAGSSPNL
jgi:hypothetical protein